MFKECPKGHINNASLSWRLVKLKYWNNSSLNNFSYYTLLLVFSYFTFFICILAKRYLYRDTSHLVLDILSFQIYLVRKSVSTQKASIDSDDPKMRSPGLCSLYQKYLQICVRCIPTTLLFCSVSFGKCWKFLVSVQITHYETYLVS